MKKQVLNEEFKRMQKLAGIIKENMDSDRREIDYDTFEWNEVPEHPEDMLMDYEEGDEITKAYFWETNIINEPIDNTIPDYATKENGKWRFSWGTGNIGGFVEGEDFTF